LITEIIVQEMAGAAGRFARAGGLARFTAIKTLIVYTFKPLTVRRIVAGTLYSVAAARVARQATFDALSSMAYQFTVALAKATARLAYPAAGHTFVINASQAGAASIIPAATKRIKGSAGAILGALRDFFVNRVNTAFQPVLAGRIFVGAAWQIIQSAFLG
jgi:hypothetical protein